MLRSWRFRISFIVSVQRWGADTKHYADLVKTFFTSGWNPQLPLRRIHSPDVDLAVGATIVERLLVKSHGALEGSAGEDQRTRSEALDQPIPHRLLAGAELDDRRWRERGICRIVN